jgi:hypothetical protein
VITINPNGTLAPNVFSVINGTPYYAQVLVQNINPVGPVNLIGITVDGSGPNPGCGVAFLAGIFYASGSSGMVNEVTTRNQAGGGCGVSIYAENGAGTSKSITIENSSVHDTGDGILVQSVSPPTLSATIRGNFLSNTGMDGGAKGISGIGQIEGHVITSITGEVALGIAGSDTVSGNTLADILDAAIFAGSGAMQSNKLSKSSTQHFLGPSLSPAFQCYSRAARHLPKPNSACDSGVGYFRGG